MKSSTARFAAGDTLPSERRLAELLGVSRPAVREALQRMSATRLVEVRHGGATTVRDFQRYAGLDLLPRLLVRDGELDPDVARSIVEARFAIAPGMVRLACTRAPRRRRARRRHARPPPSTRSPRLPTRWPGSAPRWRSGTTIVDLADSLVFRLLFNNLRQAYEPAMEALAPLLDGEVSNVAGYRAVADRRTRRRHRRRRRAAADDLLRPATDAIVTVLDDLEDAVDAAPRRPRR